MARPLRLEFSGALYHVTSRGNRREAIYDEDNDRVNFLTILSGAIDAYKQFVCDGKGQPSPWEQLKNQVFLGDDKFVESMQGLIEGDKELSEIPTSQRRSKPKELPYYAKKYKIRNDAIISAYKSGGYSLKEVGDYFKLHYSTVSGMIKNHKSKT